MLSTVTDKGQLTIPKAIRDQLDIRPGTRIEFEVQPDNTLTARVLTRGSAGLFGLLQQPGEIARSPSDLKAGVTAAVIERAQPKR